MYQLLRPILFIIKFWNLIIEVFRLNQLNIVEDKSILCMIIHTKYKALIISA